MGQKQDHNPQTDPIDNLSHLYRTGILLHEKEWRDNIKILRECPYAGMPGSSCKELKKNEPKRTTE